GNKVTCQANNHGLQAGDSIIIVRSSAYAGTYPVSQLTENSFDIEASFNANAAGAVTALWAASSDKARSAITGFVKLGEALANEGTVCESNGHDLKVGDSILITGSDQYNGVYSLANVADNQFTIDTPFIEADIALGAGGGKGNGEHHTFNGRPAYILKNSIQVGSNVSIIGFNPQDTVVVKNHAETKIKLLGTAETPITGVRFAGWSFDGRADLSTLGGELITQGHGGGFFLRHVHHCVFHCTIVNHLTKGLGGGIYGDSDSVTSIRANAVISNSANSGKGVYGCHHSELRLYDCDAKNCNDTIVYQQAAQGEQHLVLAKETTAEVLQVTRHGHFMGTAQFDMPATFNKTLVADTAVVKTRLNAMQSLRIGPELIDAEQALIIAAQSGYNPVGITQASYGGTSTMELTTQDDAGKQATRICLRGGHNQTNIEFLRGAQGAEQVSMMINGETGFIGIGTSEPECPLDIRTYGNITTSHFGFLNTSKPTGKNSKKASRPYAIRTALRIAAAEFNALSDGRIKKIVNHSNRQMDLACLLKLKITDYRYIDEYQYGNEMKKGLIAQQVEAVFPQAVQRSSNVIPDIFSSSDKVEYSKDDSSLTIYLNQTVTLSVGDQVRLIDDHQGDVEKTVVAIAPDKKSFTVAHWQSPSERVFVYGKQVDDCRSVDYDRILMLCVSSVQAQQAEQQALAQENKHLHQRLALLEKQFAALQSQFKSQANCASADCVSEGG
ncbi:MAG: tail fiber domain-containing protein, partial [Pseudomonadota bacterium]